MTMKIVPQRGSDIYAAPVYENGGRIAELILVANSAEDAQQQAKRLLKDGFHLWYVMARKLDGPTELLNSIEIEEEMK